jgi:6,7-dimethyl-8-ribityllumazine synthase
LTNRRVLRRVAPPFAPKEKEGRIDAAGLRFAVVCSRWNPTVTEALLRSALAALEERGARASDVEVIRVPGAFEIPAAAGAVLRGRRPPDAVIVLGAIVRGETAHHEVLGHAVASALASLSAGGTPIGFGLLTCDTMDQARARTAKGTEAAEAAIVMADLRRELGGRPEAKGEGRRAKGASRSARTPAGLMRSHDRPATRSDGRGR